MTFCETLARQTCGKYEVIAEKRTEKFENGSSYCIMVCNGSWAFKVIPTARTTWRKKFKEVCEEWS